MKTVFIAFCAVLFFMGAVAADEIGDKCGEHPRLLRDASGAAVWHSPQQLEELVLKRVTPEKPSLHNFTYDGFVSAKVMINTRGEVICMWNAAGHPVMIPPAMKAAREWKFKPLVRDGKPVEYVGMLRIPVTTR